MIRSFADMFDSCYEYICENACRSRHRMSIKAPPFQLQTPPAYVYSEFSIPYQHINEKSACTMHATDIAIFGRPMMLLYFLAVHPVIMLPLASMRPVFGKMDTYIPQASASPPTQGFCEIYFNYLRIVVTNRLRYTIDQLYPHLNIMKLLYTERRYVIPKLEQGPVPILEYIVRDAMELCNPVDYIVTFLEQVVYHYRTLTTDDDRQAYRVRILQEAPLRDLYNLTILYGQHTWDSRWASDDKLHRLVQVFETVTTEVFPNAFKQIVSYNDSMDKKDRQSLNDFISDIVIAIAPCFLHHYRPMQNPQYFGMPIRTSPSDYSYRLPVDQFPALMETLKSDLMQCIGEYVEHPELFSTPPPLFVPSPRAGVSSNTTMVDVSTPSCTSASPGTQRPPESKSEPTPTTDEATTQRVFPFPSTHSMKGDAGSTTGSRNTFNVYDVQGEISIRLAVMASQLTRATSQDDSQLRLPFKDFLVSSNCILYLLRSITICPPKDDPVYIALSPIFDRLTPNILDAMGCPVFSFIKFNRPYQTHT